jgi:hypothetical protein
MEKKVGRPAIYRPKVCALTVQLTRRGADALEASSRKHHASRSDIVEQLLRRFHRELDFSKELHA